MNQHQNISRHQTSDKTDSHPLSQSNTPEQAHSSQKQPIQSNTKLPWTIAIITTISLVILLGYTLATSPIITTILNDPTPPPSTPTPKPTPQNEDEFSLPHHIMNCNDIKKIVESNQRRYIGCLGGIVIQDTQTNRILQEINTDNGLLDGSIQDLLIHNNQLYIGHQQGVQIYDLETNQWSSIQQLPSNHNPTFELDLAENTLWIGTFNGVARYKLNTQQITPYTTELDDESTIHNISSVHTTPNAVYVAVLANAESPGAIARLDKQTQEWISYGPKEFSLNKPLERIDGYTIKSLGNTVYWELLTDTTQIWQMPDVPSGSWSPAQSINQTVKPINTKSGGVRILAANDQTIFFYNQADTDITNVYQLPLGSSIPTLIDDPSIIPPTLFTKKLSIYPYTATHYKPIFKDRPDHITDILAKINHELILNTDEGIWSLNAKSGSYNALSIEQRDYSDLRNTKLIPISNTNIILQFSQDCGMICQNTTLNQIDYTTKQIARIELPQTENQNRNSYQGYTFYEVNQATKTLTLIYNNQTLYTYNLDTQTWDKQPYDIESQTQSQEPTPQCAQEYQFDPTNGFIQTQPTQCQDEQTQFTDITTTLTPSGLTISK